VQIKRGEANGGTIAASDPVVEQQTSCLCGRGTGTRLSTMTDSYRSTDDIDPCVRVYGTRVHNLRGVDVVAPRDALVAFTGISGSGKSSLAFGTIYAEAQRRYFESVAPYARRLLLPTGAPKVDDITGLPPAVALQQRRGSATSRSTVGTVTTLSNLLRMLFSHAGTYPRGATERLDSDAFSPNTAVGACPDCHGLGRIHRVTEETLVLDPSLGIREGAIPRAAATTIADRP
jgi:excinuclease ABC subunit A